MGFWKEDPWGFKSQWSHLSPSTVIEAAKVRVSGRRNRIMLFSTRSCPAVLATWHQLQIAWTLLEAWLKRNQSPSHILTSMGWAVMEGGGKLHWEKEVLEFSSKILTHSNLEFWEQISMSLGRVFLHNITMKSILINPFFFRCSWFFLKSFSHINQFLQIKKKVPLESTHHITLKIIYIVQELKHMRKNSVRSSVHHTKNVTAGSRDPLTIRGSLRTCTKV